MLARTKNQKIIMSAGGYLRPLTAKQKEWAFRNSVEHFAYRHPKSHKCTCMDCGHQWKSDDTAERCSCPNCKADLKMVDTFDRTNKQKSYFNVLTTCKGYQVLRIFFIIVKLRKGLKAAPGFVEVGQYWINGEGKCEVRAIQRTIGYYIDSFAFGSPMEIRRDNDVYRHLADQWLYPHYSVIPELKRNGFKGECHNINPVKLMVSVLTNPMTETLMKSGDYEAVRYSLERSSDWGKFWGSYKVANRHGYKIENISLWCDYLSMLDRLGKDIHSPSLIMPKDLKAEHDKYVEKLNRQRAKERMEADRKRASEDNAKFQELKSRYFGLAMTDGELEIHTLDTIDDYYMVGESQHICVATARYYLKSDSLVFVAYIADKQVATVEISLEDFHIIQCRAFANKVCKYQDRIAKIIKDNTKMIAERKRA